MNERLGMDQYLVPYLMSSHPGSTLKEAVELAEYCRDLGYMLEQVQEFLSDTFYAFNLHVLYGNRSAHRSVCLCSENPRMKKAMQRALIQYRDPKHYDLVLEALRKTGRMDLVGYGPKCLIRPGREKDSTNTGREKQVNTSKKPAYKKIDKKTNYKKKTIRNVHRKK